MNHLEGQRFGNLTVIEYDKIQKKWKCQCDCGNITYVPTRNLKTGNTISCGCMQSGIGRNKVGKLEERLKNAKIGQLEILSIFRDKNMAYVHCLQCKKKNYLPLDKVIEMYRKKRVSYTCGIDGCSYTRNSKASQSYNGIKAGDKFGKLTVIKRIENKISKTEKSFSSIPMFLCQCECGNTVEVQGRYLINGSTKSCGCKKTKNFDTKSSYKHIREQNNGELLYNIYRKWKEKFRKPTPMFKRNVTDKNIKFFPELEEQQYPFELFYQWAILNGFSEKNKYLDRRNYLKDFSSDNCFWTSLKTKGY